MDTIIGATWAILGSLFLGTFALPSKYVKGYQWENTWGAFFFFAMLVVPIGIASLTVQGLWAGYENVSGLVIFGVIALSFLWGCGFCCWGYGLSMVGLSLGYSLTMGTMALVGSMVPFFIGSAQKALTLPGVTVVAGVLICVLGVVINGYAGVQREKSQIVDATHAEPNRKRMWRGLAVCILAGVLSSGLNIAFYVGNSIGKIAETSQALGNPAWLAGLSTWTLVFLGGAISSVGYSIFLLTKHGTWNRFTCVGTGRNLLLAFLMGVGHFACIFFYGIGGWRLGELGTSVGFAVFQSGSLLVVNGLGVLGGEWDDASSQSRRWLLIGLTTLILGIVVVSFGNAWGQQ